MIAKHFLYEHVFGIPKFTIMFYQTLSSIYYFNALNIFQICETLTDKSDMNFKIAVTEDKTDNIEEEEEAEAEEEDVKEGKPLRCQGTTEP